MRRRVLRGLPVGLWCFGGAWEDTKLIRLTYGYGLAEELEVADRLIDAFSDLPRVLEDVAPRT